MTSYELRQFMSITGSRRDVAEKFIEAAQNKLQNALNAFFDVPREQTPKRESPPNTTNTSRLPKPKKNMRPLSPSASSSSSTDDEVQIAPPRANPTRTTMPTKKSSSSSALDSSDVGGKKRSRSSESSSESSLSDYVPPRKGGKQPRDSVEMKPVAIQEPTDEVSHDAFRNRFVGLGAAGKQKPRQNSVVLKAEEKPKPPKRLSKDAILAALKEDFQEYLTTNHSNLTVERATCSLRSGLVDHRVSPVVILQDGFFFPCLDGFFQQHNGATFRVDEFSAALKLHCPDCKHLFMYGPTRKTFHKYQLETMDPLAVVAAVTIENNGDATGDVLPSQSCFASHSLLFRVMVAADSILEHKVLEIHLKKAGASFFHVEISVRSMKSHPMSLWRARRKRDALGALLELCVVGFDDKTTGNSYPNLNNAEVQELQERNDQMPFAAIGLGGITTNLPKRKAPVGIQLPLKEHQEESLAFMLRREQEETRDFATYKISCAEKYLVLYNVGTLEFLVVEKDSNAERELNPSIRGGMLCDEMGLGKTLVLLSLIATNKLVASADLAPRLLDPSRRLEIVGGAGFELAMKHSIYTGLNTVTPIKGTLILLPVSISGQWMTEINRCWPAAKVLLYHGVSRNKMTLAKIQEADIILSTYETFNAQLRREECLLVMVAFASRKHAPLSEFFIKELDLLFKTRATNPQLLAELEAMSPNDNMMLMMYNSYLKRGRAPSFFLSRIHFHRIVLDECQKYQKEEAAIHATNRWLVSGTPFHNSYSSLQDFFKFLGSPCYSSHRHLFIKFDAIVARVDDLVDCGEGPRQVTIPFRDSLSDHFSSIIARGRTPGQIDVKGEKRQLAQFLMLVPSNIRWHPRGEVYNQHAERGLWFLQVLLNHYMVRHMKADPMCADLTPQMRVTNHEVGMLPDEIVCYKAAESTIGANFKILQRQERYMHRIGRLVQWIDQLCRLCDDSSMKRESIIGCDGIVNVTLGTKNENEKYDFAYGDPSNMLAEFREKKVPSIAIQILEKMVEIPPEVSDCPVCFDTMHEPTMLQCYHFFCRECILSTIGAANSSHAEQRCPTCRSLSLMKRKTQVVLTANIEPVVESAASNERSGPGSKLTFLMGLLRSIWEHEPEAKTIIFSKFSEFIRLIGEQLRGAKINFCVVDGSTTLQQRSKLIKSFQDPASVTKICLLSSRAGNAGLTLTAAHHLILMEANLNQAAEAQSMGRIHRLGQIRPVTIHRVVAKDSIESRIVQLIGENVPFSPCTAPKLSVEDYSFILTGGERE